MTTANDTDEIDLQPLKESLPATPEVPGDSLPAWTDARTFVNTPNPPPPEIIHGVLHQGCKLVLGGSSKTFKSWTLLDLALSVATGSIG